ncbi:MAG: hypothetical protein Q8M07_20385, partial [Prosthecobacter sp.]|nr:hypothetical protein [Prosthecobacter sp.]
MHDVLEEWENYARGWLCRHEETVSHSRAALLQLASSAGTEDLRFITANQVMRWLSQQPSVKTAANKLASARAVFKYLLREGRLLASPLEHIELPKVPARGGADSFTEAEYFQLLDAALRHSHDVRSTGPDRVRLYMFLWFTALRIGEARTQRWADIDWREGTMRL